MKTNEDKAYLCALNRIFGFEPKIALALLTHIGSAEEIFRLSGKDLDHILGPYSKYRGKIHLSAVEKEAGELERLSKSGIDFIGWTEDNYPQLLKECEDAPVGLYIRSRTPAHELFGQRTEIAIVGTRDISMYGTEWCSRITEALARTGRQPRIISGLALGTDICAHKAALDNGLETIGIMATGPETIYPRRHREFAMKLCDTPGCALITDYPPGTAPLAIHFLRRNRIIAGMSKAVILIESKIRGGGLMTARLAFSYNRDVLALPGRIDDLRSQGCNALIRNKIAEPITSIEDFLTSLDLQPSCPGKPDDWKEKLDRRYRGRFPEDHISRMADILLAIKAERGITVEDLSDACNLDYLQTVRLTGLLQADGLISIDLTQRCAIIVGK